MSERQEALDENARKLVSAARKKLAQDLPELLSAIYLLQAKPCDRPGPMWTDGITLYYHPESVIRTYLNRHKALAEQLLHIIVHGLLGHCFKREEDSPQLFDAAADLKATDFIYRLNPSYLHPKQWKRETKRRLPLQDGSSLERLCQTPRTSKEWKRLLDAARPLAVDDHRFWGRPEAGRQDGGGPKQPPPPGAADRTADGAAQMEQLWQMARQQTADSLRCKDKGSLAGEFGLVYREARESGVSYRDFLRRFLRTRERAVVDPDSIDRIWYHLGLSLTGDVPLVEPEELREDAGVLELAVALDTSGSCQGEIMRRFLGELLAILRDGGGPRMELTLILCDAEIQEIRTLTREDSADELAAFFVARGGGGTDFRPVFDYVDRCRLDPEEGKRFRGLLYLSDGWGEFPKDAPDYPVAFLYPGERLEDSLPDAFLPPWVTRVWITADDRLDLRDPATE